MPVPVVTEFTAKLLALPTNVLEVDRKRPVELIETPSTASFLVNKHRVPTAATLSLVISNKVRPLTSAELLR